MPQPLLRTLPVIAFVGLAGCYPFRSRMSRQEAAMSNLLSLPLGFQPSPQASAQFMSNQTHDQ
jgi:hypothetical protein